MTLEQIVEEIRIRYKDVRRDEHTSFYVSQVLDLLAYVDQLRAEVERMTARANEYRAEREEQRDWVEQCKAQRDSALAEVERLKGENKALREELEESLIADDKGVLHHHECIGRYGYGCKAWCPALTPNGGQE